MIIYNSRGSVREIQFRPCLGGRRLSCSCNVCRVSNTSFAFSGVFPVAIEKLDVFFFTSQRVLVLRDMKVTGSGSITERGKRQENRGREEKRQEATCLLKPSVAMRSAALLNSYILVLAQKNSSREEVVITRKQNSSSYTQKNHWWILSFPKPSSLASGNDHVALFEGRVQLSRNEDEFNKRTIFRCSRHGK